jgi:hypothetical protein
MNFLLIFVLKNRKLKVEDDERDLLEIEENEKKNIEKVIN